ncbi:MAG: TIGR02099 family protein [Zoogloeaceae bacterium]|nr:TIGR02099 family protein [Zoogloeaceae bacterium]
MINKPDALAVPDDRALVPETSAPGRGRHLAMIVFIIAASLLLLARQLLVPAIERFQPELIAMLERSTGLPVTIEQLSAEWTGLRPRLKLAGVAVRDLRGEAVLRLDALEATLAWSSVLEARPIFHRLVVVAPELAVRRTLTGKLLVAGMPLDAGGDDPAAGFGYWLSLQHEVIVRGAVLQWMDEARSPSRLDLRGLELRLLNSRGRHRFALVAEPPLELASKLEVRADLVHTPGEVGWAAVDGRFFVSIDDAVLGAWRSWLVHPAALTGFGNVRAWIDIEGGQAVGVTSRFALVEAKTRLGPDLPELHLANAEGRVDATRGEDGLSLAVRGLKLDAVGVTPIGSTDIDLEIRQGSDGAGGRFALNRIDFSAVAALAAYLPLEPQVRKRLSLFAPRGRAEDVKFAWSGDLLAPDSWNLDVRFFEAGLRPEGRLPGFEGFSGEFSGDSQGGRFRLDAHEAALELPAVFPEPRLALAVLQAQGGWQRNEQGLKLEIEQARFENPDAAGTFSGSYVLTDDGPGLVDLSADLSRADGEAVWRYLPLALNERTRDWLRKSLTGGAVPEARFRLEGDLRDFPFVNGKPGEFLVVTHFVGANLDYADAWPAITGIDGEIRFEGPGMFIKAKRATVFGVELAGVSARVPDLGAKGAQILAIEGMAEGPSADFLRFIAESPISREIGGLADTLRAVGRGALTLGLEIPLHALKDTQVKGSFQFAGNRVTLFQGFPGLAEAAGQIEFSEREFAITRMDGRWLGEPVSLTAKTLPGGGLQVVGEGGARVRDLSQVLDTPLLKHLSGGLKWQLALNATKAGNELSLRSDLKGLASSLPAPYSKRTDEVWPLVVTFSRSGKNGLETLGVVAQDRLAAEIQWMPEAQGRKLVRGGVGLFEPARSIAGGIHVGARLDTFDLDAWQAIMADRSKNDAASASAPAAMPIKAVDARVRALHAFGQSYDDVELHAIAEAGGWDGRIVSGQAKGTFAWRPAAGKGALRARLSDLIIPEHAAGAEASSAPTQGAGVGSDEARPPAADSPPPSHLPALDIVADRFLLRGMDLGRLSLQATNRDGVWDLSTLELISPDGRFSGSGHWIAGGAMLTEMKFELDVSDIGGFLARFRHPDALRSGSASLAGDLTWRGAPTRIDYPSLSGALTLEAQNGQFLRLDPGVGRLLGVLSLQALPRRLTLDFRDVFSEGFAFDRISGSIALNEGVMRSDNFEIVGPAARVSISGTADVDNETQNLEVTVQPTLSESIAIGAAAGLINPVAGVVTYLAQKALSDPIEKIFAFRYAIKGSWADPQVEKLEGAPSQE